LNSGLCGNWRDKRKSGSKDDSEMMNKPILLVSVVIGAGLVLASCAGQGESAGTASTSPTDAAGTNTELGVGHAGGVPAFGTGVGGHPEGH
jgi:hypothetical protein